jgi:hypothetical protein
MQKSIDKTKNKIRELAESVWPLKAYVSRRDAALAERNAAILVGMPSERDRELTGEYFNRRASIFAHGTIPEWLTKNINDPNMNVLEVGSREVACTSIWQQFFQKARYTGFDYLPGDNVQQVYSLDLPRLAQELACLRAAMKQETESTSEQDEVVGAVAAAEKAAAQGDGPATLRHLKAAGKWALGVAEKIGVAVAAKAIETAMAGPA